MHVTPLEWWHKVPQAANRVVEAKMRIFGWALIVVGTLMFARTVWLGALYFHSMSPTSQTRYYLAPPVSLVIAVAGIRLLCRARIKVQDSE